MLTLTIFSLREHDACDLDNRIAAIHAHLGRDVADDEPIHLLTWASCPWTGKDGNCHAEHSTEDLLWALRATEPRDESERIAREVACRTAERVLHLTGDARPVCEAAIHAGRDYTTGRITDEQRSAAWSAARSAAWSAAWSAVWSAARSAAWSAVWSAARSAAWDAARSAAESAAWDAAESAAWDAARSAARSAASSAARSAAWDATRVDLFSLLQETP